MGTINISDLRAGMVLAAEVRNLNGQVLLGAGTAISAEQVRTLKAWGIMEVDVAGLDRAAVTREATASLNPQVKAKVKAELDQLFSRTNREHPAMEELHRLAVLRKGAQHSGSSSR